MIDLRNDIPRSRGFLVAVVTFLLATHASFALKVQQMSPLELLQGADVVVTVKIDDVQQPWKASVTEVIKSEGGAVDSEIRFTAFSARRSDYPVFQKGGRHLLFLGRNTDGTYQCLSYGKQGIWPKNAVEWPFKERHVASFQETRDAFVLVHEVLGNLDSKEYDEKLAAMLRGGNRLIPALATELIAGQPPGKLPMSRQALTNLAASKVLPHAVREVTILEKDGLHLIVKLPDAFDPANPSIIFGVRNPLSEPLLITRGEPSEGFRLSLYDRAGKRIPAEKEWAGRNDPRLNDAGLRAPDEIASGGRLDSPSFPLNKIFGERWREGKWLEVEWGTRVSHVKQPAGWWMVGSIDIQALAKEGSLKMVATPDRASAKIDSAKPEEELVRLAMERAKEEGIQVPEGVKPLVHYRGYDDTYVSIRWEWKDGDVVRSFYVGIDRVTGKISDFVNAGPKK